MVAPGFGLVNVEMIVSQTGYSSPHLRAVLEFDFHASAKAKLLHLLFRHIG